MGFCFVWANQLFFAQARTEITPSEADCLKSGGICVFHDGGDCGVHARGVAATCQHADATTHETLSAAGAWSWMNRTPSSQSCAPNTREPGTPPPAPASARRGTV